MTFIYTLDVEIQLESYCRYFGTENPEDGVYCHKCGKKWWLLH